MLTSHLNALSPDCPTLQLGTGLRFNPSSSLRMRFSPIGNPLALTFLQGDFLDKAARVPEYALVCQLYEAHPRRRAPRVLAPHPADATGVGAESIVYTHRPKFDNTCEEGAVSFKRTHQHCWRSVTNNTHHKIGVASDFVPCVLMMMMDVTHFTQREKSFVVS